MAVHSVCALIARGNRLGTSRRSSTDSTTKQSRAAAFGATRLCESKATAKQHRPLELHPQSHDRTRLNIHISTIAPLEYLIHCNLLRPIQETPRMSNRAIYSIMIPTTVSLFIAIISNLISYNQLESAKAHLSRSYPPVLKASHFHMWETGNGKPNSGNNNVPPFDPGTKLTATLLIVNHGSDIALIGKGGCIAHWQQGTLLPMDSPLNRKETLRQFHTLDTPTINPSNVKPGDYIGCTVDTEAPKSIGNMTLFVIGYAYYSDKTGLYRALYFARRYDPMTASFVIVKDQPDYEGSD